MNSNECILSWELAIIDAIKKRDLYLCSNIWDLMKIKFGKSRTRNFITQIALRRDNRLSVNDNFWIGLNAYFWIKSNGY